MALIPNSDPTPDQRGAFDLLLEYCLRVEAVRPAQILTSTKITNVEYQNFRRGTNTHYKTISTFIERNTLKHMKDTNSIPSYVKPLITLCFPDFFADRPIESPNDVFLREANLDSRRRRGIAEAYSGIFNVYRYSSHLHKDPESLIVETSDDGQETKIDPWMICAGLRILPTAEHDEFVRFKILYSPYEVLKGDVSTGSISEIDGIIISIKELMYFIGLEQERYPLIIISKPHYGKPIDWFNGLILRHHEFGRTIASRVGFSRAPNLKSLDDMRDKIGMERESRLLDEIAVFKQRLINSVDFDGKCALLAELP